MVHISVNVWGLYIPLGLLVPVRLFDKKVIGQLGLSEVGKGIFTKTEQTFEGTLTLTGGGQIMARFWF